VAMRTGCSRTALGNLGSVRPKRIVKKSVRLRFNFTVAEYSIAVLAVQSPLRHSGTLWREAGLTVTNNAKTQRMRMFHIEHRKMFAKNGLNLLVGFNMWPKRHT
jgi:hypothetical protein